MTNDVAQETLLQILLYLPVLVTAIPVHELAHAWAVDRLGDPTPRRAGRLTFSPLEHLDVFGSIALLMFGFGWGRSVPVNSSNFRRPNRDMALAALAGPAANVLMAVVWVILSKPVLAWLPSARYTGWAPMISIVLDLLIMTNLSLAVFNLIPFPPLDGANLFAAILPRGAVRWMDEHTYAIGLGLFVLLAFGFLQIPIGFLSGWMLVGIEWLTSPLNLIFR